ncbi:MAG: polyprenyl synthetase family protein [Clostridium sp.]|jgi:octaprenyl-diphosphate synthase|uniref:polyprenyl synthetase family protein n=1 Tax=Clostridium sp. TaxID=1506 RepID=UPI0025C70A5A|nr:polyprenyl synthetase family protein [Clostridium sp.]MCH3962729.1 polyprenyl synthetase family protein [Clostridium sp.]MCI1715856.1 polyprenyl synthetase family protein [Clostridium sp.]MCI1799939.1 polyprenyl synthetase family protein [Clostridium sp.]MCI1813853.1 polyprenyl synthetase family protein [Clostridium sp.]MCI1870751.1 polyprenyl synthetase family protein [Clostridium sp.]
MEFSKICLPIAEELDKVKIELKTITNNIGDNSTRDIFKYFFSSTGKYLRPILTLLSSRAVNNHVLESVEQKLIHLCVGIELIHSASLIHDDIIDGDSTRRNHETLNRVYGDKIALLTGDALYSRAFLIFSDKLPKGFSETMGIVTEVMSASEILNASISNINRETYLKIVEEKTAFFMGVCCGLGAALSGADEKEFNMLLNYGHNLGVTYQILDDYIDKDPVAIKNIDITEAFKFASNAKDSIKNLKDSNYVESLTNLVDYVLDLYKPTIEIKNKLEIRVG